MQITLGNYYSGHSLLHRLDPRLKLVGSIALMVLLFFLKSFWGNLAYAVFLVGLIALSQVPARLVFRSLKTVMFLAAFAFVLNLFAVRGEVLFQIGFLTLTREGLQLGIRLAMRLFYLVMTTSLLVTLVTTPLEIADAMERLFRPLARIGFPAHELAMMMSIALRFVPTLAEETEKIMQAQASRGADFDTGGLISRLRGLLTVLVPLFISSFKRAEDLALAMEARCYRGGEGRTKLKELVYKPIDVAASLALIVIMVALIGLDRGLQPLGLI